MSRSKKPPALGLADISPPRTAGSVTARVMANLEQARMAVGAPRARLRPDETPVYARVYALACYAAYGTPLPHGRPAETEVRWVEGLLHLPKVAGEPHTMIEAMLLGALAREAVAARRPLSAPELALLSGYDRDHVLALAADLPGAYRAEREPRAPWRFRVTRELLAFLRDRATAGGTSRVA